MAATIFNGPLTANFQPTRPVLIPDATVVLDFDLTIAGVQPVLFSMLTAGDVLVELTLDDASVLAYPWSLANFQALGAVSTIASGAFGPIVPIARTITNVKITVNEVLAAPGLAIAFLTFLFLLKVPNPVPLLLALTNVFSTTGVVVNQALPNISGTDLSLDFWWLLSGNVPTHVEWYPEFTMDNPFAATARWFRECAEEDTGNGDVRMPFTIRRFTPNGVNTGLPDGRYYLDTQFKRTHMFYRLQMRGRGCTAQVLDPFGTIPTA